MSYIRDIQMIIDSADPWLVDVLSQKNESELMEYIEKLYREYNRTPETSVTSRETLEDTIEVAEAMMKRLLLKDGKDGNSVILL